MHAGAAAGRASLGWDVGVVVVVGGGGVGWGWGARLGWLDVAVCVCYAGQAVGLQLPSRAELGKRGRRQLGSLSAGIPDRQRQVGLCPHALQVFPGLGTMAASGVIALLMLPLAQIQVSGSACPACLVGSPAAMTL